MAVLFIVFATAMAFGTFVESWYSTETARIWIYNAWWFEAIMAFFMIFTLTRAVNRLSQATESVRGGDFSVRIPVRRRDQIGQLQHSFNEMAAGLEGSVAAVAQKEILKWPL